MKKSGDGAQRQHGGGVVSRSTRSSFRALSGYLKIVSSGASSVARSASSAATSIVDRGNAASHDQVLWAGFDKLEGKGVELRRVLLLGYRSGFQVWDAEEYNVRLIVARRDGPVFFLQMLPKLVESKRSQDTYAENHPLAAISTHSSSSSGGDHQDGLVALTGRISSYPDVGNGAIGPTILRFYSFKSQSYVHTLKFRSVIYTVRCSSRVVAVSLAAQIHCFASSTLEREYIILSNPIVCGPGSIGYGPLAVGPRWIAYSGKPVATTNSGRLSPQHLTPSETFSGLSSNDNLVTQYVKFSSKQLAAGIVTLRDIGYRRLSKYCSEILPDAYNSLQWANSCRKSNGTANGHSPDADSTGMVIVRDLVSKRVISQFRAHHHPISALCFDQSGTLLVTASIQGHNMNVFKIIPGQYGAYDVGEAFVHLYRLQRGVTSAVIQDISFSDDSNWVMVSSSRGTSHLFAINPTGELENSWPADADLSARNNETDVIMSSGSRGYPKSNSTMHHQPGFQNHGPPVTLAVVHRIRIENNNWIGTVSGAAAAAAGRISSHSGPIASVFSFCEGNNGFHTESDSLKMRRHLLIFSPLGCMIQYALRVSASHDSIVSGLAGGCESESDTGGKVKVEAVQKWTICQQQSQREQDYVDIYSEDGTFSCNKVYPAQGMLGHCPANETRQAKVSLDEKNHMYISGAELQMHEPLAPIWANPEIYFQSMVLNGNGLEEENTLGGEYEIERIPTRIVETRLKDLIPVFDSLQRPNFQQSRLPAVDSNRNRQLMHQNSWVSRSSSFLLNSQTNRVDEGELCDRAVEAGYHGVQMPAEAYDEIVHNNDNKKQDFSS